MTGRWIDKKIRAAMESGEFDNLPGKGKPLNLDENPHTPEDWRLAYHVLQSQGVTLPWIDIRREIQQDYEETRRHFRQLYRFADGPEQAQKVKEDFLAAIAALNQRIRDFNLQAPLVTLQLFPLNDEKELAFLTGTE